VKAIERWAAPDPRAGTRDADTAAGGGLERLAELLLARMLTKVDNLCHQREALLASRFAPNQ